MSNTTGQFREIDYKFTFPTRLRVLNIDPALAEEDFSEILRRQGENPNATDIMYLVVANGIGFQQNLGTIGLNAGEYILATSIVVPTRLKVGKGNIWNRVLSQFSRFPDGTSGPISGKPLRFHFRSIELDFVGLNNLLYNFTLVPNIEDHRSVRSPNRPANTFGINNRNFLTYMQYEYDLNTLVEDDRLDVIKSLSNLNSINTVVDVSVAFTLPLLKDYFTLSPPPGGSGTLGGLTNTDIGVDTLGPSEDGHVLKWDNTAGHWTNLDPASLPLATHNLDFHDDVTISGPTDGQALVYNNGTAQWENTTLPDSKVTGFEYKYIADYGAVLNPGEFTYQLAPTKDFRIHKTDNQAVGREQFLGLSKYFKLEISDRDKTTGQRIEIFIGDFTANHTVNEYEYNSIDNVIGDGNLTDGGIYYLSVKSIYANDITLNDDYDDSVFAFDGAVITWNGTKNRFEPQAIPTFAHPYVYGDSLTPDAGEFFWAGNTMAISKTDADGNDLSSSGLLVALQNNFLKWYSKTNSANYVYIKNFEDLNDTGASLTYPLTDATADIWDTYEASASSVYLADPNRFAYKAFDGTTAVDGWHSDIQYDGNNGLYIGTASIGGISGEWLKIDLGTPIILQSYTIDIRQVSGLYPRRHAVLGSNDNISWTMIQDNTGVDLYLYADYVANGFQRPFAVDTPSTTAYRYYAIVTTLVGDDAVPFRTAVNIWEWDLIGSTTLSYWTGQAVAVIGGSPSNLELGSMIFQPTEHNSIEDISNVVTSGTNNGESLLFQDGNWVNGIPTSQTGHPMIYRNLGAIPTAFGEWSFTGASLLVKVEDADGNPLGFLGGIPAHDVMQFYHSTDRNQYAYIRTTGAVINQGGYWEYPAVGVDTFSDDNVASIFIWNPNVRELTTKMVDINDNPATLDNQVLAWNTATNEYDPTLPSLNLLSDVNVTGTLIGNQLFYNGGSWVNRPPNDGTIKINNGNGIQPTFVNLTTVQSITYASPLGVSSFPTSSPSLAINNGVFVDADIYDFINNRFLEQQLSSAVHGGQIHLWRFILNYSNKQSGNSGVITITISNALSGFQAKASFPLPSGVTAENDRYSEAITIADNASKLPSVGGTGAGYDFTIESSTSVDVVITSIARIALVYSQRT